MKGIVLAGGTGSRLAPMTLAVSKHLLPVADKPMIYYPLTTLMSAGVTDILVISTPADLPQYRRLLGDGAQLGLRIGYAEQPRPEGIAQALLIGAEHIGGDTVALALGDNVFAGPGLPDILRSNAADVSGCVLFGAQADDPRRYGIGVADADGRLVHIEEKPARPRSSQAITGLYFYDNDVVDIARRLEPSGRGELEITDVNRVYVRRHRARLVNLGEEFLWRDAGTPDSLRDTGRRILSLEKDLGSRVACVEEVALRLGLIDARTCHRLGAAQANSGYGEYVMAVARGVGEGSPETSAGASR
ncbi:sugar nucleotidyltransferase [Actinomadura sediminis]|uniref:Glucose-1-phosphate thymidylyltransferase n=1 Tax=Actinomadura sediminis TaxID=1038904 RepID=A0ABW3EKU5_9ACTN